MNTIEIYLGRAVYDALLDGLCALKPDPLTGQYERHQFVELLGEAANVWPVTVLDDPARSVTGQPVELHTSHEEIEKVGR